MSGALQRVSATLLALALLGCSIEPDEPPPSTSAPSLDAALSKIASCPAGDGPWREALSAAERGGDVERLARRCTELEADCPLAWQPAWILGRSLSARGETVPARSAFERCGEKARVAGSPVGRARCLDDLAWIIYGEGNLGRAESTYRQALAAAERSERVDLQAFVRNNLAPVLVDGGKIVEALEIFGQVERGLKLAGLEGPARGAAYNAAVLQIELGDAWGARDTLLRIREEAAAEDDRWTLDASAVVLGNLHRALGEAEVAERWFSRVGKTVPELMAKAVLGRGRLALGRGDFAAAERDLDAAAAALEQLDYSLSLVGRAFSAVARAGRGEAEGARNDLAQVAAEARKTNAASAEWLAEWLGGRLLLAEGRGQLARESLSRAVGLISAQRRALASGGDGLRFLRERREPFVDLARALLAGGGKGKVEGRAASILRVMRLAQSLTSGAAPADDREGAQSLRELREGLDPGELMLSYLIGESGGVLLAAGRDSVRLHRLPPRSEIAPRIEDYRRRLRAGLGREAPLDGWEPPNSARELSRLLLGPVEAELREARRLLVVPDRELALLPLAALPWPGEPDGRGRWVGLRLETAVLPVAAPPQAPEPASSRVLLAGRPELEPDSDFAALPWSGWELSEIARVWPAQATALLTRDGMRLDAIEDALERRPRVAHFATHAVASTRDPRRCGVMLSSGDHLGLDRIAALRLDGTLVVLSACHGGEGELVPGEGVIGLTRGFLGAGASGVLGSLWVVEDQAAARLMVTFHERLAQGLPPAAALAAARRLAAERGADPARWAAFELFLSAAPADPVNRRAAARPRR